MGDETLGKVIIAAIAAISTIAGQYGFNKLTYKKAGVELQIQQQEHTDSLYVKIMDLQKSSILYIEEAHFRIEALNKTNSELKDTIESLTDELTKLQNLIKKDND